MNWTIVKVGGSLYDWPKLGERLRAWLNARNAERVLLVPGGGATADAIRSLDRVHHLGEEASHWLAIRALSLNARFLQTLLPDAELVSDPLVETPWLGVLDAFPFFAADEERADHLPHVWCVTSDSLAMRLAVVLQARELILLKSRDWTGDDWPHAMEAGVVDAYFGEALKQASPVLQTRVVNLRVWSSD
jgi:5-(aminomethyl)-3-furanmethanol phosphate kinase